MIDTLNIKSMESKRLTGATDLFGAKPADAAISQTQSRQLAMAVLRQAGVIPADAAPDARESA